MNNSLSSFTTNIQSHIKTVVIAALAVVVLIPGVSAAQQLEEIVVTASRRGDADIMTTPLAMTALAGEAIAKFSVRDLNDVAVMVPGLSSGSVSGFKSAQFSMRGTTETSIILYKESPVGVTMDDFVVPVMQTSNLEMFDIETVEVLRGPQGTLFGKNTTGGVINVRTKQPVLGENSGEARVEVVTSAPPKANLALNFRQRHRSLSLCRHVPEIRVAITKRRRRLGADQSDPLVPLDSEHAGRIRSWRRP